MRAFRSLRDLAVNALSVMLALTIATMNTILRSAGAAHWIRMEMFNRPDYDNVLYVDCDVLIHPRRYDDNIFLQPGTAVRVPLPGWNEYNMGVVKWTKEECEIMKDKIDLYFHPQKNQKGTELLLQRTCWGVQRSSLSF